MSKKSTDPTPDAATRPDRLLIGPREPSPLSDVTDDGFEVAWAMVEASPDGLVMVDEAGLIKLVNRQTEILFGYDRADLLGRPVEVLLPGDLAGVHQAHRTRYRVKPTVRTMGDGMHLLARRADNSTFPVEISLSPLTVNGHLRVIAAVRDISERVASQAVADRTRRAVDTIRDGVYLIDPERLQFVHVNQGAAVQSGYSTEELIDGMGPLHLAPTFTAAEFEDLLRPLLDGTTPSLAIETVLRHRSGRDVPVDVVMDFPEVDVESSRVVVAVVRDISARIAAEEHVRLVQHSIDSIADAVFICREETLEFTYVNQGALDIHGYTREELLGGMTPTDLAPTLDPAEIRGALERLGNTAGASVRLRTEGQRKDGTTLPVEVDVNWPAPGQPGGPRPVVAVVRDVSEQVDGERALRASEARFRAAFDEGPVPMTIVEVSPPGGRDIVAVNQALADLFGYSRQDLVGRPAADLLHAADVHSDGSLASAVAAGEEVDYEHLVRGIRADGTEVWLQRHVSALDPDGARDKLIVHVVDVTARMEADLAHRRQEALTAALSTVRLQMLGGGSRLEGLTMLCQAASELLAGSGALILTPTEEDSDVLAIEAAVGVPRSVRARMSFRTTAGAVGEVFQTGEPRKLNTGRHPTTPEVNRQILDEQRVGPLLLAPLPSSDGVAGVLVVVRIEGADPFSDRDLDPVRQLAAGAVAAIDMAQARLNEASLQLLEDRERIARDIHDNVIGRLFGTGMTLQALLTVVGDPTTTAERISTAVEDIDHAIKDIRTAIYGVRSRTDWGKGVRGAILALGAEYSEALGFEPAVELGGPIDDLPEPIVEDVLATIREALTNAVKHANATTVSVSVTCGTSSLEVQVSDNGAGFVPTSTDAEFRGNGVRNMTDRADAHGGAASIVSGPDEGTTITWTVPLASP